MTNELEEQLLGRAVSDLCRIALIASGVETPDQLNSYMAKFQELFLDIPIEVALASHELERIGRLFDWLWRRKPARYQSGGNFKLTDVLDVELDPARQTVGNCLGLTLLYNVLLERLGFSPTAVHLDSAFGRGPHVFTVLHLERHSLDIENILLDGFDYRGHLSNPHRKEWDNYGLAADIYTSEGNLLFEAGRLEDAVSSYDKAILLNSDHPTAVLNRSMALAALEDKPFDAAQDKGNTT